jgi:hypothetical protein
MGAKEISCKDDLKSEWLTSLVHSIDLYGRRVQNHVLTFTHGLSYTLRGCKVHYDVS